ncbi:MAG: DUF4942 domain-containing protein [Rectinemataceae bacterium]
MIPNDDDTDVTLRDTIESIYERKVSILADIARLSELDNSLENSLEALGGYRPYRIDFRFDNTAENRAEKYVDRVCWYRLISLFHLERYMLCTDYQKMESEIQEFRTPAYTVENARAWIAGLKDLINDNIKTLIKRVFQEITDGTYRVGGGWNGTKKKRNNNGIDKNFILDTGDWSSCFGYWSDRPTVTDDLEKVCYLLSGKTLPEKTAKAVMRDEKKEIFGNEYFTLRFCKNGNTHYTLADPIRDKLNLYGPEGAVIGENIKIKVFENRWASRADGTKRTAETAGEVAV